MIYLIGINFLSMNIIFRLPESPIAIYSLEHLLAIGYFELIENYTTKANCLQI